jgi:NAD(P)-dependent dehydrogenase (short-subunit alcohol dehydrogenase family)
MSEAQAAPDLRNKVALVTGAASGIGKAIARRLALSGGACVCIADSNAQAAQDVVAAIEAEGGRALFEGVDLADAAATAAMLARLHERIGALDIVINNAGIAATLPVLEYPLSHWQDTLAINVTAPFIISQHALRGMRERGWGRIVNIASISGIRAGTGRVAYGTSKAALIALTRQFAIESATWGVTVNAVAPGPVDTPLLRALSGSKKAYAMRLPMRRFATVEEIADAVSFLVSDQARYITGETLAVDGGFLASGLIDAEAN